MLRNHRWRKLSFFLLLLLALWVILAQSCMKFRISDAQATVKFTNAGVALQTHYIDVDGYKMHYVSTGSDSLPTLFFVHGSPGSWTAFERYLMDKELLAAFRMVAIDRPGFGYSEFGEAKNLDDQSRLIRPIIDSISNGQPMYVIGHSLGGPVAVKLEAAHPGSFAGIILLAGSVDPGEEKPEKWRPWLINTPLQYLVPGAMEPANQELWYLKKDLVKLKDDFSKIHCPVWIIHGDKDNMVPVGNADYAGRMLVNAPLVDVTILKGAGHFIPWNHFTEIKKILLKLPEENIPGQPTKASPLP